MSNSAKALLFDTEGKILVLWRSDTHPKFAHHLDFPGGLIDDEESPSDAVSREIFEETGLNVPASDLQLVATHHPHIGSTQRFFVANINLSEPEVVISWEHELHKWLTLEEFIVEPMPTAADIYHSIAMNHLNPKQ